MNDKIKTKVPSKEYSDNYDKIFGKKIVDVIYPDSWDEERIDIIGQNGALGLHYPDEQEGQGE
jgi:hypothetical protein